MAKGRLQPAYLKSDPGINNAEEPQFTTIQPQSVGAAEVAIGAVNHNVLGNVTSDQHHPQLHAAQHQPGGGDAMAVDAAAATGSLRTLGAGGQQAAAGTHTHVVVPPVVSFVSVWKWGNS